MIKHLEIFVDGLSLVVFVFIAVFLTGCVIVLGSYAFQWAQENFQWWWVPLTVIAIGGTYGAGVLYRARLKRWLETH